MKAIIPLYDTKPIRTLSYEHQYLLHKGDVCKKGGGYLFPFVVEIIPQNLVIENNKYTYHHAAKRAAEEWMYENQKLIFIEWWGPDHSMNISF